MAQGPVGQRVVFSWLDCLDTACSLMLSEVAGVMICLSCSSILKLFQIEASVGAEQRRDALIFPCLTFRDMASISSQVSSGIECFPPRLHLRGADNANLVAL